MLRSFPLAKKKRSTRAKRSRWLRWVEAAKLLPPRCARSLYFIFLFYSPFLTKANKTIHIARVKAQASDSPMALKPLSLTILLNVPKMVVFHKS